MRNPCKEPFLSAFYGLLFNVDDFRVSNKKVDILPSQAGAFLLEAACCSKLRRWTKGCHVVNLKDVAIPPLRRIDTTFA
jgi:hypothetical protein